MAWRYDSWESYFYPETINPVTGDGTLRNLYDEHDPRVLARFEYIETTGRATELLRGDVTIPKTYDAAHMRAIHRHLFQDVYEWAGEYRTVNMSKQWPPELGRGYTDVHLRIEPRRTAAGRPAVLPMAFLILSLRDHRSDLPRTQQFPVGFRRVRLVREHSVRLRAWTPRSLPGHAEPLKEERQHRRVPVLPGRAHRHQGFTVPVDELMRLRRQPAPGPPDRVIKRLGQQILVIRRVPFLGA